MDGITRMEIEFRMSEILGWIKAFIDTGQAECAGYWASELVRIAKLNELR